MADASEPNRRTLAVYERGAADWQRRRTPSTDLAERFAAEVTRSGPDGPVIDLGCGPGWHLPHLPEHTIALDGARAMLDLVPSWSPGAPRLQADLRALPVATGALAGAWAEKAYVHLARTELPLALRDLHRATRVGAPVHLGLFGGDLEHGEVPGDDFPGRSFSNWPHDLLLAVLEGAGFPVEDLQVHPDGEVDLLQVRVRRERTIADTVGAGMRLLLVGLNPSLVAADAGVGFHRRGNRAWPALLQAGLATVDRDPDHLLVHHRIGMTDLVKRATPRAAELTDAELAHGVGRLDRLCAWLRPGAVCVLGVTGWRRAVDRAAVPGVQPGRLGGRPVYLMPNPSGANAHVRPEDLVAHLRAALERAEDPADPPD